MKRRIALAMGALAATMVVLLGVPMAVVIQRLAVRETFLELERDAASAALTVSIDGVRGTDPIELPDSTFQVSVYDTAGGRVAGVGPERGDSAVAGALASAPTPTRVDGSPVVALPLTADEQLYGAVRAAAPPGAVASRARPYWLLLAALALGSVSVAALLANVLGVRLARPIQRIAAATSALGSGRFDVEVDPTGIAEIDDASEALRATARRLGDVISRERAFSAEVSHQLRTPLAGLRLDIERSSMPEAEKAAALEHVERLSTTIDDLMDLGRHAPETAEATHVGVVFRALVDRWTGPLAARGRRLTVEIGSGVETVAVSEPALRQILDVLVENAGRHGSGVVTVAAREIPGGIAVEVADEGTDAGAAEGSGTGIGLPLASALAEAEGARLVGSPGPDGTVFRLLTISEREPSR